jgi:hypothetical protein
MARCAMLHDGCVSNQASTASARSLLELNVLQRSMHRSELIPQHCQQHITAQCGIKRMHLLVHTSVDNALVIQTSALIICHLCVVHSSAWC